MHSDHIDLRVPYEKVVSAFGVSGGYAAEQRFEQIPNPRPLTPDQQSANLFATRIGGVPPYPETIEISVILERAEGPTIVDRLVKALGDKRARKALKAFGYNEQGYPYLAWRDDD